VDGWVADGLLQQWTGNFGEYSPLTGAITQTSQDPKDARFVAVPTMGALCEKLVQADGIHCHFGRSISVTTREAVAETDQPSGTKWRVTDAATGEMLKEVDWIISTDR
jgi:predicted NAD/FAD-dependent oxidoreductase